ncbi:hypothetical protein GE061_013010 [Apolygus lucorum]|uniref:CCHC-type domain-containing protein n=1 Tax=Apolygus lucorum TaxID=248454 RepID=A0A8S9XU78_APOLU|nr:hypothetical protein GE061_013010 [Apolygus lucorum]
MDLTKVPQRCTTCQRPGHTAVNCRTGRPGPSGTSGRGTPQRPRPQQTPETKKVGYCSVNPIGHLQIKD